MIEEKNKCEYCGAPYTHMYVAFLGKDIHSPSCDCLTKLEKEFRDRQRQQRIQVQRNLAHIPTGFRGATLQNFSERIGTENAHQSCLNYTKKYPQMYRDGTGLIMIGSKGSGKTHLASGIANAVLDMGYSVRFWDTARLCTAFWPRNVSQETAADIVDDCMDCGLLILDDLGAEGVTDASKANLRTIINVRHENLMPTIITTNLNRQKLEARLDERVIDRLFAKNNPHFIQLTVKADSYRGRSRA